MDHGSCDLSLLLPAHELLFIYLLATDALAVPAGHYARLRSSPAGGSVQLLRGVDPKRDQSYFLASVSQDQLRHFMFPVGECPCPVRRGTG